MRTLATLTVVAALALALSCGAVAGGARPQVVHFTSSDTFPDELCGIPGTSSTHFLGDFKFFADGTFLQSSNFSQLFTAASNGRQVEIAGVEQVRGPFDPVDNGDGTITQTYTFNGLPEKLSLPNGRTLTRDAGTATVAITFAVEPDGRLQFLSQQPLDVDGPHPELGSGGTLFCDLIVAALA
jgi:hypothetical protein